MLKNISLLKSQDLIGQLKTLVKKEKAITLMVIDYLTEVQKRKAYLPKYTSLFTFLTDELVIAQLQPSCAFRPLKHCKWYPKLKKKS